jgi:hypothetical protein
MKVKNGFSFKKVSISRPLFAQERLNTIPRYQAVMISVQSSTPLAISFYDTNRGLFIGRAPSLVVFGYRKSAEDTPSSLTLISQMNASTAKGLAGKLHGALVALGIDPLEVSYRPTPYDLTENYVPPVQPIHSKELGDIIKELGQMSGKYAAFNHRQAHSLEAS